MDVLNERAVGPPQGRPLYLVASDVLAECALESGDGELSEQAIGDCLVVRRTTRHEAFEKPEALLAERGLRRTIAPDALEWRRSLPSLEHGLERAPQRLAAAVPGSVA